MNPAYFTIDDGNRSWLWWQFDALINCSYINAYNLQSSQREQTLRTRGLDLHRAKEVFAGPHFTREDERYDYGEVRFVTVGWLDGRLVVFVWTLRGVARRVISMRHCHGREAKEVRERLS